MASYRLQFEMPDGMRKWGLGLSAVGLIALIAGIFTLAMSKDTVDNVRFWAVLLQNSTYFLLICNASMFFLCATTLAWGGWQVAFRRIPEAISTMVPIFGVLALIVLFCIVYNDHVGSNIYLWLNKEEVAKSLLKRRPEAVIERAVKGMLPKNRLGRKMYKKLFVYAGAAHQHTAQQPKPLTF